MLHSFPRSILALTALAAITGIGIVAALSACTSAPQAEEELGSISTMADIDAWRIDYDDCMLKAGFDLSAGIPMQSTEAGEFAPTFGDKSPRTTKRQMPPASKRSANRRPTRHAHGRRDRRHDARVRSMHARGGLRLPRPPAGFGRREHVRAGVFR